MRLKIILLSLLFFFLGTSFVFSQSNTNDFFIRAQKYIQSGDYSNAIILLKKSLTLHPKSARDRQKLAYAYYLNRENKKAEKLIKEVLRSNAANVQTYQIAGDIYKGQRRLSKAQRNFKKGLKKFPESGVIYSELGQVYYDRQKYSKALESWIEGIQVEPDYAPNYYFAARTYYLSQNKFWTIIYGEIFINLERFTNRTADMKKKLLAAYKDIIGNTISLSSSQKIENGFSTINQPDFKEAVTKTLAKSAGTSIKQGVNPETLMMTRTQFLIHWDQFYKLVYPFALFDYYQALLQKGLFEAYNKWMFGPANNPSKYKSWVKEHIDTMYQLIDFLNNHSLQPKADEFYQKGKIEFEPILN